MLRFGVLRYVGGVILTPRSNCVLVLGPYMLASRSAFTETNTDIAGSWGWCCFSFDCVIPMMYLFAVAFMVFLFFWQFLCICFAGPICQCTVYI